MQTPTTINDWLAYATHEFSKANIPTARLDAEILLCHMLGVDRAWLVAHTDDSLARAALSQKGGTRRGGLKEYGEKLILQRLQRIPVAYLVGQKEFYGRDFIVTPDVLIPRPETETLIELLREIITSAPSKKLKLLDVGTGSGIIGLTAKLEFPTLDVTVSDISSEALAVAQKNGVQLKAKPVEYIESDLLSHWLGDASVRFDIITANLPYVDKSWERSPETKHEPSLALFADEGGLKLILQLINEASQIIVSDGFLLLEADPEQHAAIVTHSSKNGFRLRESRDYCVVLVKD